MEATANIMCPYCGQEFELVIDTSIEVQALTTDCEICCRPMTIDIECEPGSILSLAVKPD